MTARRSTRRTIATALAVATALVLAGGVGAVAASKASKVRACADAHGYLATATRHKCPKGTHALNLGVSGPRGSRGRTGVKGAPGTNGLSQVYVGVAPPDTDSALAFTYATELTIASAPAGIYVINWNIDVNDTATADDQRSEPECFLAIDGTTTGVIHVTTIPSAAALGGTYGILANTQVVSVTAPGEIDLQCDLALGHAATIYSAELNATRVNTATPSAG